MSEIIKPRRPLKVGRRARDEAVAGYIHYIWASWTNDMLAHLTPENIAKWKNVANRRYNTLKREDKEFCREWAKHMIRLIDGIPQDFTVVKTDIDEYEW